MAIAMAPHGAYDSHYDCKTTWCDSCDCDNESLKHPPAQSAHPLAASLVSAVPRAPTGACPLSEPLAVLTVVVASQAHSALSSLPQAPMPWTLQQWLPQPP